MLFEGTLISLSRHVFSGLEQSLLDIQYPRHRFAIKRMPSEIRSRQSSSSVTFIEGRFVVDTGKGFLEQTRDHRPHSSRIFCQQKLTGVNGVLLSHSSISSPMAIEINYPAIRKKRIHIYIAQNLHEFIFEIIDRLSKKEKL
jgi:hypothetical protein